MILFEDEGFVGLLPSLFWRTVFELRLGRKIVLDRTAQRLNRPINGIWTRDWIARVAEQRCGAPVNRPIQEGAVLLNGRWIVDEETTFPPAPVVGVVDAQIAYVVCDHRLAECLSPEVMLEQRRLEDALSDVPRVSANGCLISYPWDILRELSAILGADWVPADAAIETELDPQVTLAAVDHIHVGERSRIHPTAIIDATAGPIYLSHDVQVGPFVVLEGPLYLGPGTQVHPHAWLHGGNAVGPVCKLGGEIAGCVISGYTNKQHEGFLGHAYVGSWVNIGAGTANSDLKNTYGSVRAPINGTNVETGATSFGAVIGDHAKVGINSSIPTGAVLGFASVAATSRLLPKYVPSFGWVTDQGISAGKSDRLLDVATKVMARRHIDMTDEEIELFLDLGTRVQEFEAKPRPNG